MIPEFVHISKIRLAPETRSKDKPKPDAAASSPGGRQHTVHKIANTDGGPKRTPTTLSSGPKPPEAAWCGRSAAVNSEDEDEDEDEDAVAEYPPHFQ